MAESGSSQPPPDAPFPVSIVACFLGLFLLAGYRRAKRSLAFICPLFAAMFLSALVTKPSGEAFDRANLLLAVQCLLPTVGFALGEMFETARAASTRFVARVGDWMLFGHPVFSSVDTFLFGHTRPLPRSVRTSAHNYYMDLAYNFGTVALPPISGLVFYTLRRVWVHRCEVRLNDRLAWMVTMVLLLLVVDSALKVTLRQPYPGIFACFLWGLVLARLRSPYVAPEQAEPSTAFPHAVNA